MASNVRKFSGGRYLIVARMFGRDIPLFAVTGYDWAEKQAQRLQARTGHQTFIRSAAPVIDARAAEVVPATGVEIVEVV